MSIPNKIPTHKLEKITKKQIIREYDLLYYEQLKEVSKLNHDIKYLELSIKLCSGSCRSGISQKQS